MKLFEIAMALLPALATSIVGIYIARSQAKRDRAAERHLEAQKKAAMLGMEMNIATLKLSEATAIAVRDGKCNGELKAAMAESQKAKHEYYDFLNSIAFEEINK